MLYKANAGSKASWRFQIGIVRGALGRRDQTEPGELATGEPGISHSLTVGAPFPCPAVAALRPLIVSNELFSNDGLEVVAIFFFASFFFSGLWKKAGARGDRGLDCFCAARAPWRYEFKAPAYETLSGRLSNATMHRQQTHTPDAVLRGLHYKGCARSGQAGAAQKGVASC